jgi:hypothetical protein
MDRFSFFPSSVSNSAAKNMLWTHKLYVLYLQQISLVRIIVWPPEDICWQQRDCPRYTFPAKFEKNWLSDFYFNDLHRYLAEGKYVQDWLLGIIKGKENNHFSPSALIRSIFSSLNFNYVSRFHHYRLFFCHNSQAVKLRTLLSNYYFYFNVN